MPNRHHLIRSLSKCYNDISMTAMPREIADSDGESDLGSPNRPSASPIPENVDDNPLLSTLERDPFANIEFDKFLSPTQRLSSALERQDAAQPISTNSTDQFLREIAQHDQGIFNSSGTSRGFDGSMDSRIDATSHSKTKRTFSDIEGSVSASRRDIEVGLKPVKRAKTYGNSKIQRSDPSFFSENGNVVHAQELQSNDIRLLSDSEALSADLPVEQLLHPDNHVSGASHNNAAPATIGIKYHQRGSNSFAQGNIQNTSITKSSMGGYEGINLDFRGVGLGLDVSANPFGSLSQVSLDGDVDPSQIERFASHFQYNQQPLGNPMLSGSEPVLGLGPSHLNQMATSPITKTSSGERQQSVEIVDGLSRVENNHEIPKKKRGRKSKSAQNTDGIQESGANTFEKLQSEDPLDIPLEHYKPRPSRSRAGTVESLDNHQSHSLQPTDNRKRKKPSNNHESEDKSKADNLSSELSLSDPAMIGAPKEMYVPKPSRSRSKRIIEEDDQDELQMDENNVDTGNVTVTQSPSKPPEVSEPTITKKKPGRKSKVKRAKTSAAALLKSAEMYDEDDKDCFIVDEAPAKVKMAPLPEISPVKMELDREGARGKESDDSISNLHTEKSSTEIKISIDIPKLPKPDEIQPVPINPEPKKRGRKPKKKSDVEVTEEPDKQKENLQTEPTDEPEPEQPPIRPALTEKDPNTVSTSKSPTSPTPISSPKKPVHSPLKPASRSSTPSSTTTNTGGLWSKPRVGLSRRTPIPSLLRKLDRSKEPPKVVERKEKLSKRQQEEENRKRLEAEDAGEVYVEKWEMRGKDGMLLEWDD